MEDRIDGCILKLNIGYSVENKTHSQAAHLVCKLCTLYAMNTVTEAIFDKIETETESSALLTGTVTIKLAAKIEQI